MDVPAPLDILVIEDDADTRANLRDILELDGHRVESAGTAAEALGRDDWSRYSAIILDRRLPDATADEFLPQLKAAAPEAAIIVVTGYSDIQGAIAALRLGASDYILKPLNPEVLRTSLGRVSERRRLALAKERSEAAFRHLVEAADCMIVILRPDHSILYFSPYAERLTGYPAAEVLGRDYLPLFLSPADRRAVADEVVRVLAGRPTHGFENPVVCRDGSLRWMAWNARPLADYDGSPAVMKVGQDITYLKQAQQRSLQAERLSAIGEMVAGLAHESRNALQRSQACLEMLALADRDRPESLDLIARVQKAQDHLHHLYEDVRGYAAPIVLDRRQCDLREVWREAWAHLESARLGERAALREEVAGEDMRCLADPFRLEQVFCNILENALSAGQGPIEVTIRCESPRLDGQPVLRVSVRDNGPGLDADQRRRIFDPFFTTKAKGTGLGMAIAKRIVEAHGGQISVGGDDGDQPGAVFVLTLPRGIP
jgi:two-component system, LuxR family, sensor kinase FixL